MESNKSIFILVTLLLFTTLSKSEQIPTFDGNKVLLSQGPFAKSLSLTNEQIKNSESWKNIIHKELLKEVNFAGHYRIFISKRGEFPSECGVDGWVCGWIIDKSNGHVVSELPMFNGNTKFYSTIDNNTPSPTLFSIEFYPMSNLLWLNGENVPRNKLKNISYKDVKCVNNAYIFRDDKFSLEFTGEC